MPPITAPTQPSNASSICLLPDVHLASAILGLFLSTIRRGRIYYLEWHMRQRVAPMLFDDTDKEAADALRASIVAPAQRLPAVVTKQTAGLTQDGLPVHSFRSLLADLATVARNTITTAIMPDYPLTVMTRPTPIQNKAFHLLGIAL